MFSWTFSPNVMTVTEIWYSRGALCASLIRKRRWLKTVWLANVLVF
jgi:hypothetical protein